jgi:dihydrofolate reductase
MTLSIIVAMSKNGVIGKDNKMLWRLPNDLRNFKEKTKGNIVIMGRKTFESLNSKPLPDRINIVVSRDSKFLETESLKAEGKDNLIFLDSLEQSFIFAESQSTNTEKEFFVIGGEQIYKKCLQENRCDRIYRSTLDIECAGDVTFPEIDMNQWVVTHNENIKDPKSYLLTDEHKTPLGYTYEILERKRAI